MNKQALILLFIANSVSGIAQGISMIAIPWFFAQKSMLVYFGYAYVVTNILSMFWVPVSGSIIDRFSRKKVFLILTAVIGLIIGSIAIHGLNTGGLAPWIVAAVFTITFLNYNIHYPCMYAFIQEITEPKYYSGVTSLFEIVGQSTTILSGAFAALLLEGTRNGVLKIFSFDIHLGFNVTPWTIEKIFGLDAMTYGLAFVIIAAIRYTSLSDRHSEYGSTWRRIISGFRYLKAERSVLWFGTLSYAIFIAVLLESFYLGASYVKNHLETTGDVYATSKMAYSLGAIVIGFFIRYVMRVINIPLGIIIMTLAGSVIFFILAVTKSLWIFFTMMFLIGIINAGIRISRVTYLFNNVSNQYFGRAGSVFFLFNILVRTALLGIFALPFFQASNNIIYAFIILSAVILFSAILLSIKYRSFDLKLY